jgi:hypothetical protein
MALNSTIPSLTACNSTCIGTLRYKGFCDIMSAFSSLGLFNMDVPTSDFKTWGDCFRASLPGAPQGEKELRETLKHMLYFTKGED